jgi:hypothetical protein
VKRVQVANYPYKQFWWIVVLWYRPGEIRKAKQQHLLRCSAPQFCSLWINQFNFPYSAFYKLPIQMPFKQCIGIRGVNWKCDYHLATDKNGTIYWKQTLEPKQADDDPKHTNTSI